MQKFNLDYLLKTRRKMNTREALKLLEMYGPKFWSWGAEHFQNIKNKALAFNTNGHHHKGVVILSVNGSDLYDFHLINKKGEVVYVGTDIYFEDLFDAMDEKIERIPAYKF